MHTLKPDVTAIIMTLNAQDNIEHMLRALQNQTIPPREIIVADSESSDATVQIATRMGARVCTIPRRTFNHGGSRDAVLKQSNGKYVLFLTHDAIPANEIVVERLMKALEKDDSIAAAYSRQLAREDATQMERLIRLFNYPDQSHIYSEADISDKGIKTYFMSDVCAMYKRDIYLKIGGFEKDVKTNEDMLFAAKAIKNGYSIAYESEAQVVHSHNLSLKEQFQRNLIQGYEIERHKDLLDTSSQNAEGMRLVKFVSKKLLSNGKISTWIYFGVDCCARYLGSFIGRYKAKRTISDAERE